MALKYFFFYTLLTPMLCLNNFEVSKVENCNEKIYPISVHFQIKDTNYIKYAEINFSVPLGDIPVILEISYSSDSKKYRKLFTMREKSTCQALNKYLGEIWYIMERAAKIEPRTCPLKKGNYKISDLQIAMDKVALPVLPKAGLRLNARLFEKNSQKLMACVDIEAVNK